MRGKANRQLLILAGDTNGNIGDRAIVATMIHEFKSLMPNLKISILSNDPVNDRRYFGVDAIPKGFLGLTRLLKVVKKCKVIICGGGGLFQDDDSLIKMPYWGLRIALFKIINPKASIIGYSLGAGPLRKPISRLFAKLAFTCMSVVSVRDRLAQKTIAHLTSKPVYIVPDPALLLAPATKAQSIELLNQNGVSGHPGPLVGVAMRMWFHQKGWIIPHKYAVKYRLRKIPGKTQRQKIVLMLAKVLDRLASMHNAFFVFMPTYNVSHEADDVICQQIMNHMTSDKKCLIKISDPSEYKGVAGCMDLVLGGRMHPTIFAAAAGTNIVGLAYNQKFNGYFQLLDQAENVIRMDQFVENEQSEKLIHLLSNSLEHKSDIGRKARKVASITRQFNKNVIAPFLGYST